MSAATINTEGREFWEGAVSMTNTAQSLHSVAHIATPYSANPLDITIFVSCYNEQDTIVPTLEAVVEAMDVVGNSYEILVIDDASKDHSAEQVRNFMAMHDDLNIIMRVNKTRKGLAQNYYDGAFIGCGTYYRLVRGKNFEPVETSVDVFRAIGDADIIVPYYIARLRQGALMTFGGRFFNGLVNIVSGNRINCYTSTHVHLRYNVMRWHSDVLGRAFQMDLLCQLLAREFTCKQVPCRAVNLNAKIKRNGIVSGLSFAHAVLNIFLRRIARLVYSNR